ncbi:signal peptidase II [Mycoplasmoides pneumoniae]|uniref:Lipoprotein signal peptidase n=5 Tax=Mycoplasmoides pneumoniae TaxID=2104 RepID=LSPA_MYCPN|nr:signal peptidase II [Mycoplasmoides pneumoniae]P75484.1 RecName: Full=Lipoprotein signal peptidase; AltName: Full=Prolipoprotein signal peptidase; AltName: Full=Signal peptidase II; Short=SPase II [Mycoplasmoides pneumoniae M129]AAB96190.1 prolipoprotein signal peptidase [Mycoplasmoides pneumoniae M129]ADK86957.1 signal peptidase II [Mycoplasmoides pneumoniae FH]AGC04215.1 signal peptidase II [Mycoplasmoides pneumoniae M129-B7]ALA30176.1 signal peptidase II [Mycoplasmoides pneumoniae PI 142
MAKAPTFFSKLLKQILFANRKPFLYYKLALILFVGFVILFQVFMLRAALNGEKGINGANGTDVARSSFISIYVIGNKGVGFSLLADQPGLVYFLQGFLSFIALFFLVFSTSYNYIFWITTLAFGSLGNFFDRLTSGSGEVLDYFVFSGGNSVFNLADCCITFSFIGLFLSFLIQFFKEMKQTKS